MKLYLNELAPWERKNEYHLAIQLGKDVRSQTEAIKTQTKAYIQAQLKETNSILISQEKVAEITNSGFKELSNQLNEVSSGISDLGVAFEWGISEVVWQLEQNREVLKNIEQGVWSPFDAQARNRKIQADEAYGFGWIDEAEEYYLESEKIVKTDFTVHMSLGYIYMKEKIDKEKALLYFERAIKYSKPKSPYYASIALLSSAVTHFSMGNLKKAVQKSEEAIILSPNLSRAYYENAQYYAQLNQPAESLKSLKGAMEFDINYGIKANIDPFFNTIEKELITFFDDLRKTEMQKFENELKLMEVIFYKYLPIIKEYNEHYKTKLRSYELFDSTIDQIINEISNIRTQSKRNSYRDYYDLNNLFVPELIKTNNYLISSFKRRVSEVRSKCENKMKSIPSKHKMRMSDYWGDKGCMVILFGSFIVPILASLLFYNGFGKLWVIVFIIPLLSQIMSLVLVYNLIFDINRLIDGDIIATGDLQVAWTIPIFLIIFFVYYIIYYIDSKDTSNVEIKNQKSDLKQINLIKSKIEYIEKNTPAKNT